MRRPLLSLFVAFIIGLVLARTFAPPAWAILLPAFLMTAVLLAVVRRSEKASSDLILIFLILLTICIGALRYSWSHAADVERSRAMIRFAQRKDATLKAMVKSSVSWREGRYRFVVGPGELLYEGARTAFPVQCQVEGRASEAPALLYGDVVEVRGTFYPVRGASIPGGFDYRQYLAAQNVYARFWVNRGGIQATGRPTRLTPWQVFCRTASSVRQRTLAQIGETLPEPSSSLLSAIVLGERPGMPDALMRAMIASGVFHVTAVSGLHISFIAYFVIRLLKWLGFRRRTAWMISIPWMLFFLAMIGFRLPTIRAVILGWAVALSFVTERDVDTLSSISAAGLAILFIWPLALFQVGFQLSFAAVVALVVFLPKWASWTASTHWPVRWFWNALGASLIAQAAVSPILAYHYPIWSPIGVLSNPPVILLVSVLLILGLAYIAVTLVLGGTPTLLAWLALVLLKCLESVIHFFAGIPGGHFFGLHPQPLFLAGWYAVLLILAASPLFLCIKGKSRRLRKSVLALAVAAVLVWVGVFGPKSRRLEIDFLNLGQGDCIFVRFPEGGTLLVDGGARQEPGYRPVQLVQYLHKRGVRRISAVVNTHPQSDHIGNLPEVLEALEVGAVFDSGSRGLGKPFELYQRAVENEGCVHQAVRRGQRIHGFPAVAIDVLSPNADYLGYEGLDVNTHSVVLHVQYRDFSCLLTGDIPGEIESELVEQGWARPCEVLKVAHHGSQTSSIPAFLGAVHPETAIIQVGRNLYGHPSPLVLSRLREYGADVLRTDQSGTIRITSDGTGYWIRSMRDGTGKG